MGLMFFKLISEWLPTSTTAVYAPHVLGELSLGMFVELLIGIGLPVIEISLVVTVAKVLAKSQILVKIVKNRLRTGIVFERGFGHKFLLVRIEPIGLVDKSVP